MKLVPEGERLDHLAAVLPDRPGGVGAASDDTDEADHPLWPGGCGGAERGPVGRGDRDQSAAHHEAAGADTTVVPSNVAYPTDSGLLAKVIGRIAATKRRIQAAGGATLTSCARRSRAAGKRAHAIGFRLRSRSAAGRTRHWRRCGG